MTLRILVADDDPHIREIICFALEKAGMKTLGVADGAAALQAVERRAPDLIVLDIGMPEMDGLEVCRRLRQKSDVPVLFCPRATRRSTASSGWRWAATTM